MNGQQMGPENKSFLDRGTLIAMVLVGVVWFGWSKWVETKYPTAKPAQTTATTATATGENVAMDASKSQTTGSAASDKAGEAAAGKSTESVTLAPESFEPIVTDHWAGQISSNGMAITGITLKNYTTRDDKPILIGSAAGGIFAANLVDAKQPLSFRIEKQGDGKWVGVSNQGAYTITREMELVRDGEAAGRALKVSTSVKGDLSQFPGLTTTVADLVQAPASSSFLAPSYDHYDWFVRHEDTNTRTIINPEKPEALDYKTTISAALSSHYFTAAIADQSPLRPEFKGESVSRKDDKLLSTGVLTYKPMVKSDEFKTEQVIYVGAKDVKALRAAHMELAKVIDYGMFAVIAEPLLWLMRFFFGWFGNWGFAIIGLTIVVRTLVLPFNIYSFKSMKVMQQIQPQMQQVRERYKDDPRRMNEEVMKLMKDNKANPLGGCLPMLLQLPVFFALYQVLAMSIDLYRQPFIFWINDLTVKDPFFVLPVLMGISMFLQQKITPVADPQQAKILMWMPVIFSLLMFTLPSGLTLYIFVSTLFGIIQQYVLMRDKSPAQPTKTVREAKA